MELYPRFQSRNVSFLSGLVLLGVVGFGDYITGYQLTFILFYLLPILYVLRRNGQEAAFLMALLSVIVWWLAAAAAGERFPDYLTPIWNMGIRLAVFILIILLASARDDLKKIVAQRTAKLEEEIQERTRLEKELLESSEREQRKIGHDLHDSLGQHLTATAMAGKVLVKRLDEKSAPETAMSREVVRLLEEGIELTRKIARSLHPIELETEGLPEALRNLSASISKAFGVQCEFEQSGTVLLKNAETGINFYRIAQEAASNAIRHGRARKIKISLEGTGQGDLRLTVADDGTGLSEAARTKKGMGLRIMQYRAGVIGATFDIQNVPAGGARAVCVLNLSRPLTEHGDEN